MNARVLNERLQRTLPGARVVATRPSGCREILLYLFDPEGLQGPLSHDTAQAVVAEPAYWSFCWASGQALAAYILQNPATVAGKRVIDFGSGSGVVAVAAAIAGACEVVGCDIDENARLAIAANASLNQVEVTVSSDWFLRLGDVDVVTAADVLYDRDNRDFLQHFCGAAPDVLLADSRIKDLADDRYQLQATVDGRTWPDLQEFEEFNTVRIYRARRG
ncbi:class I SAM-dependent methyltransferase [Marinobacter caseinilyticus]|uniref:class I SAM-dependent methyltransferase n=1 Tax=Marinobacter caseinilyticus TaxID=2692195 RepID=UPI00140C6E3E|nr:50S ribosomal protein L11 methyltransferase [Marinobacter caseinilyticus]